MSAIRASAPGKVVLAGEYAVLDGAPAVAMAVDRRAVVTLVADHAALPTSHRLRGGTDVRLLDCVCDALRIDKRPAGVVMDTRSFADAASGRKLGIGSSAALAAALVRALAPHGTEDGALFALALDAHRRFQGGRGSGVDVGASVSGGLIRYCSGDQPLRLAWPDGLHFALLWSGVAASTAARLARLESAGAHASRAALCDAAGRVAAAWDAGDADAIVVACRVYVAALRAFDIDHGLGIFDAGHDRLAEAAAAKDVLYKPCGAGGGDVGIVLGSDRQAVYAFADGAARHGFRKLDLTIDERGARLEEIAA